MTQRIQGHPKFAKEMNIEYFSKTIDDSMIRFSHKYAEIHLPLRVFTLRWYHGCCLLLFKTSCGRHCSRNHLDALDGILPGVTSILANRTYQIEHL